MPHNPLNPSMVFNNTNARTYNRIRLAGVKRVGLRVFSLVGIRGRW